MGTDSAFHREKAGIYIHIPFCVRKCIYCDFNSIPGSSRKLQSDYFAGLKNEISLFRKSLEKTQESQTFIKNRENVCVRPKSQNKALSDFADTLFIGGGTPSSAEPSLIEDLLYYIRRPQEEKTEMIFLSEDAEITMEVNPATAGPESLKRYYDAGINRISIGVQSFDNEELKFLGRIHTSEDAERCFSDARKAGFDNINIDLIFGIPGTTVESWKRTLKKAISLRPDHISFYSLQIEEGTPLYEMFRKDIIRQVSDEENRRMYHEAIQILNNAGFHHYEISNAARPGKECRHNLKYWSMCDYAGFGVSAHSYLRHPFDKILNAENSESEGSGFQTGIRTFNEDSIPEYLRRIDSLKGEGKGYIPYQTHKNSLRDEISESLFTGLRKKEGIFLPWFDDRFSGSGVKFLDEFGQKMKPFIDNGDLIFDGENLRFTIKGFDISNYILSELI